jgi:hypothetical protein
MKKPTIGQTLFLMPRGNQLRRSGEIRQCKVISVGNKYFKAGLSEFGREITFHIGSWIQSTNSTADWQAFESEQEIIELQQSTELYGKIRNAFGYGGSTNYTLAQLKQVAQILNLQN